MAATRAGAVTDPRGPSSGSYRVFRGGGWLHFVRNCRLSFRLYSPTGPGDFPE